MRARKWVFVIISEYMETREGCDFSAKGILENILLDGRGLRISGNYIFGA